MFKTNYKKQLDDKLPQIIEALPENLEFLDRKNLLYYIATNYKDQGQDLAESLLLKHTKLTVGERAQELKNFFNNGELSQSSFKCQAHEILRTIKNNGINPSDYGIQFSFKEDQPAKKSQGQTKADPEKAFPTSGPEPGEKDSISENLKEKNRSFKLTETRPETNIFFQAEGYLKRKYEFRFNNVTQEYQYKKLYEDNWRSLNENTLYVELRKAEIKIGQNQLISILKAEGFTSEYDPILDYFDSLSWNRKENIKELFSYIKAKDQEDFENHFRKWMVRTVYTGIDKKYYQKQAFILVGSKQDTGKSTFCRFLCPPKLEDYIAENISTDKDSRILLAKNFLINLDELSTLSKTDITALKALFSKEKINERLPYDRKNSIIPRRCSFLGSTNKDEFLTDETGSVRWLCFEILEIDWNYKKNVDINQVWAEAYYLLKSNKFEYELTAEEIRKNEERNKRHYVISFERELIQKYYEPAESEENIFFKTASEIKIELETKTGTKDRLNYVQIGKALRSLGYQQKKNSRDQRGYFIKDKPIEVNA